LFFEQKKMGVADIDFSNFLNETSIKREYFKYFSGKELTPILSWGLSVIYRINIFKKNEKLGYFGSF